MNTTKFLLFCVTIVLLSCTTTQKDTASLDESSSTVTIHNTWSLESMENKAYEGQMPNHPKLMINTIQKQFGGNDGCNTIFGKIEKFSATAIQFGEVASTRIYCEDMEIADQYISLLGKVSYYEITATSLLLKDSEKRIILTFSKITP